MKLKNVLIVVKDIEKSKQFYKELFGLDVLFSCEGNVILTEGLVLQEQKIWQELIGHSVCTNHHSVELYFEDYDLEKLQQRFDNSGVEIEYLDRLKMQEFGKKVIRLYDPDGHLIEIGESNEYSM